MDVLRGHFARVPQPHRRDHRLPCAMGKEEIRHYRRPAARSRGAQRRQPRRDAHFRSDADRPFRGRRLQARVRCARELKRLIRSELETALAREMLGGGIGKGDHASARWDDKAERVVFERKEPPPLPAEPEQPDVAK